MLVHFEGPHFKTCQILRIRYPTSNEARCNTIVTVSVLNISLSLKQFRFWNALIQLFRSMRYWVSAIFGARWSNGPLYTVAPSGIIILRQWRNGKQNLVKMWLKISGYTHNLPAHSSTGRKPMPHWAEKLDRVIEMSQGPVPENNLKPNNDLKHFKDSFQCA